MKTSVSTLRLLCVYSVCNGIKKSIKTLSLYYTMFSTLFIIIQYISFFIKDIIVSIQFIRHPFYDITDKSQDLDDMTLPKHVNVDIYECIEEGMFGYNQLRNRHTRPTAM